MAEQVYKISDKIVQLLLKNRENTDLLITNKKIRAKKALRELSFSFPQGRE